MAETPYEKLKLIIAPSGKLNSVMEVYMIMMKRDIDKEVKEIFLPGEWAELEGTEKQVEWALKIRSKIFNLAYRSIICMTEGYEYSESYVAAIIALIKRYSLNTSAKFWIENRDLSAKLDYSELVYRFEGYVQFFQLGEGMNRCKLRFDESKREMLEKAAEQFSAEELSFVVEKLLNHEQPLLGITAVTAEEREIAEDVAAEKAARCTLSPVAAISVLPFKIHVIESRECVNESPRDPQFYHTVTVVTPERHDDIRSVLKTFGFSYDNGAWSRKYMQPSECEQDRIMEIAAVIFKAGYIVELPYEEMVKKVISGQYRPYNPRRLRVHNEKFAFKWGRGEHFSHVLRKLLPRASWNHDIMSLIVPPEAYVTVMEIAEKYGFEISKEAIMLSKEYKRRHDAVLLFEDIAEPARDKLARVPDGCVPKLIPEVAEIAPELKDE